MDNTDILIEEYKAQGLTYEEACARVGVPVVKRSDVVDGMEVAEMSDEELLELNGSLAVRAIYRALTSKKVDNTLVTASLRAVQMLEEARKKNEVTGDIEDDLLRWLWSLNEGNEEVLNG